MPRPGRPRKDVPLATPESPLVGIAQNLQTRRLDLETKLAAAIVERDRLLGVDAGGDDIGDQLAAAVDQGDQISDELAGVMAQVERVAQIAMAKEKNPPKPKASDERPTPERIAKGDIAYADHAVFDHRARKVKDQRQAVRAYRTQEPLDLYHARGLIDAMQYQAGDRLRVDFILSNMAPGVVTRYAEAIARSTDTAVDAVAAAHRAVRDVMRAMPAMLVPCVVNVVCLGRTASSWLERQGVTPSRAKAEGMVTLKLALTVLAGHYGLVKPLSGREVLQQIIAEEVDAVAAEARAQPKQADPAGMTVLVPAVGRDGRKVLSIKAT